MKDRTLLLTLSTILILSILLIFGFWNFNNILTSRDFTNKKIDIHESSRFIEKQSDLTINLAVDLNKLPEHIEKSNAVDLKNEFKKDIKQIRNGIFALAGLNFESDIAEWISPYISVAITSTKDESQTYNWLIAIESRDNDKARKSLARFWEEQKSKNKDIEINNYKDIELVNNTSFKGKKDIVLNSKALISENLLLLGSNQEAIEKAIDVSTNPELNQFYDEDLKKSMQQMKDGIALITVSQKGLNSFLEAPSEILENNTINRVIATLRSGKNKIELDSIFELNEANTITNYINLNNQYLTKNLTSKKDFILINSPSLILNRSNTEPIAALTRTKLINEINKSNELAIKTITQSTEGPLLLLKENSSWLIITEKDKPSVSEVEEFLKGNNFIKSNITLEEQNFAVWSKLVSVNDNLENDIAVVLYKGINKNFWGKTIKIIKDNNQEEIELNKINADNSSILIQKISLGEELTKQEIMSWRPLQLTQALSGQTLLESIKGLLISITQNKDINNSPYINLNAKLKLG